MTLGKRYIAVVCHPDRPDQSSWAVATMRETEGGIYAPRNPYGCDCDQRHAISKLVVDLDDLPAPDFTDEQRAQFHERMELKHAEQRQLLWPAVQAEGASRSTSIEPLTWTCSVCAVVQPADHEGLFCGTCRLMGACMSCERQFTGQCHSKPAEFEALGLCLQLVRETLRSRLPWGNPKNDEELRQNQTHARLRDAAAVVEAMRARLLDRRPAPTSIPGPGQKVQG